MKIVGVSMVKDEADIIGFTVANLLDQGVDHLIIADNLSSDSTPEILKRIQADGHPISLVEDKEVGYYQSRKMTDLATTAFEQFDADIVVPFDADEYWTGRKRSLREALEGTVSDIIGVPLFNYFPTSRDGVDQNPFKRIQRRDKKRAPLYKVAVRHIPGLKIMQGNHSAEGEGTYEICHNALIGHFPWRSYQQFENKVRNGYEAYRASTLPKEMGSHWRSYGELLENHGPDGLRSHFEEWFFDPAIELDLAPIGAER